MELDSVKLPYSMEAEQSVIGSILIEPSSLEKVIGIIQPNYFYIPQHKTIFQHMLFMLELGRQIDAVTILEELKKTGEYDEASGKQYLLQLANIVPTARHIVTYAEIVRDKFFLRSLIDVSRDTIADAIDATTDAENVIDAAEQRILNIRSGRNTDLKPIQQVLTATMDHLGRISGEDKKEFAGLPTGFSSLDTVTTGLNKSDLIILAARPGVGKTAFALNIAENVAKSSKKAVVIFSLEMSAEQLALRMLSTEALVDSMKMRNGDISSDEWMRLAGAVSSLYELPIFIDDNAGITVGEMKAKLRKVKNLGLVVVDYLQLMSGGKSGESRVNVVSDITRGLKIMAKDLNVPLVVLSQLSRDVEKRKGEGGTPVLSDLRESGSIEQDADIVIFLHQDKVSNEIDEKPDILEMKVIVAKNRHGNTYTLPFCFTGKFTKFSAVDNFHSEE